MASFFHLTIFFAIPYAAFTVLLVTRPDALLWQTIALLLPLYGFKILLLQELSCWRQKVLFLYLFFLPGVVIHELSHFLACKIVGAKVQKIKLFSQDGGLVIHEKPKLPFLGTFVISILPLISGLAIAFLTAKYLFAENISLFDPSFWTGKKIILLYFLVSILITMFPSWQDIKNALAFYLILPLVFVAAKPALSFANFEWLKSFIFIIGLCQIILFCIIIVSKITRGVSRQAKIKLL